MAKVGSLKFKLNDVDYNINVNCNSKGEFSAKLPPEVATALKINAEVVSMSMKELNKMFFESVHRYRDAETTEQLFILIQYKSAGRYADKANGEPLYVGHNNPYHLNIHFIDVVSALAFDYQVAILRTVDKVETWFSAKRGRDFSWIDKREEDRDPNTFYKYGNLHLLSSSEWKKVPFSEEALKTLEITSEKIRQASEILFNFIRNDEAAIEAILKQQKALT